MHAQQNLNINSYWFDTLYVEVLSTIPKLWREIVYIKGPQLVPTLVKLQLDQMGWFSNIPNIFC